MHLCLGSVPTFGLGYSQLYVPGKHHRFTTTGDGIECWGNAQISVCPRVFLLFLLLLLENLDFQEPLHVVMSGIVAGRARTGRGSQAGEGSALMRRTASLDTIYLKGQWPKDDQPFTHLLHVDKASQVDVRIPCTPGRPNLPNTCSCFLLHNTDSSLNCCIHIFSLRAVPCYCVLELSFPQ